MKFDRIAFASRRRKAQDNLIAALEPVVGRALDRKQQGSDTWWRPILDTAHDLFNRVVVEDGGTARDASGAWAVLSLDLVKALTKTKRIDEYSHTVIAAMVGNDVLSSATIAAATQAGEPYELEWISMHDGNVRHTHRVADGQRIKPGDKFLVGESQLRRPGDVSAPIKEWVNCRCTVAAVPIHDKQAASVDTEPGPTLGETPMTDSIVAANASADLLPWHGVLAPEGVWSGDKRMFKEGALSHRDLPLPLRYQKVDDEQHKGSVTIASIDWVDMSRGDNLMHAGGRMLSSPEADEAVGLLSHFGRYGVSVDADDGEYDLEEGDDGVAFSRARVCSAAMVAIPAFAEAYIQLGDDPDYIPDSITDGLTDDEVAANVAAASEKAWNGSASRFTPEQWKRSTILHKCDGMEKSCHSLPIKEPDGALSRAGVHAAASRINQVDAPSEKKAAAARALRSAYKKLGEDPPESLALDVPADSVCAHDDCPDAPTVSVPTDDPDLEVLYCTAHAGAHEGQQLHSSEVVTAGRGPGWLTNPEDTKRIHDYWTKPGEPGYVKVGWGTPGDFERCRVEIGEEIGENSPEDLRFLNQICAQWHHDATGFWPGKAPAERGALEEPEGEQAPAISLVASAHSVTPPHEWFTDPQFEAPTPITITEGGHISGHLADFNTCHMLFAQPGTCINPPRSGNSYAYFRVGETLTDTGPIPTGVITLGTGHAHTRLGMRPALAHYDNSGTAVADVACGDDGYGIWINGWVRPWISDEKVHELRTAPLSGDWRRNPNTGQMDMIAALAVNAPGFPVRRVGMSNGAQVALVASLADSSVPDSPLDEVVTAVADEIEARNTRRQALAAAAQDFLAADRERLAELSAED